MSGNTASKPKELISESTISARVAELAKQIDADYASGEDLLLVGVLKGSFIFLADLARALSVPHVVDFVALASYGKAGNRRSDLQFLMDLRESVTGRHVLVVEDIVDTGVTLKRLLQVLEERKPASLRTVALVRKPSRAEVDVTVDYLGFDIPDHWVVGYGLDYKDRHRTLPYVGTITPDD